MQGDDPAYFRTVSTIKHFIANNSEFNRHWGSSDVDERDLREYFYIKNNDTTVKLPNKKLVGFSKITVAPDSTQKVSLTLPITGEILGYWDETPDTFRLNPALVDIMLGSSMSKLLNPG